MLLSVGVAAVVASACVVEDGGVAAVGVIAVVAGVAAVVASAH